MNDKKFDELMRSYVESKKPPFEEVFSHVKERKPKKRFNFRYSAIGAACCSLLVIVIAAIAIPLTLQNNGKKFSMDYAAAPEESQAEPLKGYSFNLDSYEAAVVQNGTTYSVTLTDGDNSLIISNVKDKSVTYVNAGSVGGAVVNYGSTTKTPDVDEGKQSPVSPSQSTINNSAIQNSGNLYVTANGYTEEEALAILNDVLKAQGAE